MRIGVVTHYWLPHRGGVEVVAHEQALRLAARGHDVEVVTSAIGAPAGVEDVRVGAGRVVVTRHGAWDGLGQRGVPWPVPGRRLVRAWRRLSERVDVLIVHGCTYAHSPVVVHASRRTRTPVLLLQHNPHVDYRPVLDLIERAVDRTVGRWSLSRATAVASVSRFTAAHVMQIAPRVGRHAIVHPGIDETWWRPPTSTERASARERFGLTGTMVLTGRRVVPRNGVDLAIDAWIEAGLDAAATFVVVGDGPQREALEHRAEGHRVHFLGAVDDETVRAAYHAADVFVLPTRSGEGFGLAAAQAMAVGLPVVTTRGGAQEEVVLDGVTGEVVDPRAASLGAALLHFVTDPAARREAGSKGRSRVEELFTWERSVATLENRLMNLTNRVEWSE